MTEKQKHHILLVEDDPNMSYLLQENLGAKGYAFTLCENGKEGYKKFREGNFHLCILDIMLPKMDGFELAAKIKEINPLVPIIFLTSKTMEADKIRGFKLGCDDYITKPFSSMELDYRIQAILKRASKTDETETPTVYYIGSSEFYSDLRLLKSPGQGEKKLTKKEADLLKLFCERKNKLISRSFLMNHIWGNDDYFISKSMDVYITRIRHLLKTDTSLEITNVYGSGYQLVEKIL
ncbi:MAG TPA: response regulator transcription factor [Bacteroidia bacterium]|nr:response regulator transcription factor [Bacteroidia bacterium]